MDEEELNRISEAVIGAAYEVSNTLGAGFLERVYQCALAKELRDRGVLVDFERKIEVYYKGECVGNYSADLVIENCVLIETKCVDSFAGEHMAQCLNYLRATGLKLALLINFKFPRVEVKRVKL